jgi:hypothetical protein
LTVYSGMYSKTVTQYRANCKAPGCRFDVKVRAPIAEGESRTLECADGHRVEYRAEDVRSWSSEVRVGRN